MRLVRRLLLGVGQKGISIVYDLEFILVAALIGMLFEGCGGLISKMLHLCTSDKHTKLLVLLLNYLYVINSAGKPKVCIVAAPLTQSCRDIGERDVGHLEQTCSRGETGVVYSFISSYEARD